VHDEHAAVEVRQIHFESHIAGVRNILRRRNVGSVRFARPDIRHPATPASGAPLAEASPVLVVPASAAAGAPEPGAAPFSSCAFAIDNSAATAASAASKERFMIPL